MITFPKQIKILAITVVGLIIKETIVTTRDIIAKAYTFS